VRQKIRSSTKLSLSGWDGDKGDFMRVTTCGDPAEQRVNITIRDILGVTIEAGPAAYCPDPEIEYTLLLAPLASG
jgi:hypothetical protein